MTKTIPPKPPKPDPNECCGGGCVPCILDYYYDALDEWERKYGEQAQKNNLSGKDKNTSQSETNTKRA